VADLQRVLPHDDALDQQLQELLPLGEARLRQSATDPFAERLQVRPHFLGRAPLRPQPVPPLILGGQRLTPGSNPLTAILQLLQVDDPGLVGVEQALLLTAQAPQLGLGLAVLLSLGRALRVGLFGQRLELTQESFRVVE
jgi:hypothetical protein